MRIIIGSSLICVLASTGCNSSQASSPEKLNSGGIEQKTGHEIVDNAKKDTSGTNPDLMKADHIGGIKIGMTLDEVKNLLGTQSSRDQVQNWAADGRWYATYYFSRVGLALNIGSDDSSFVSPTVSSITALAACPFQTGRWVGIGSSLTEVRNAYEAFIDKEQSNDTVLVAGSVYGGLIFNFEKGKVKKMYLGAAAE